MVADERVSRDAALAVEALQRKRASLMTADETIA
jgi:hypothetical protein